MILCIGEILVDLIGKEVNGRTSYDVFAGGAPFNVACGIKNFGGNVIFIGNVGDDIMGRFLLDFANKRSFDKLLISLDQEHNTTLAFVKNDEDGERSFCFHRKNTADYFFNTDYFVEIENADIVHVGTLMLSNGEGRKMADLIIETTKKSGKLLSLDINFRDDIYKSKEEAIKVYQHYASKADIIKYSLDELQLFSSKHDIYQALNEIAKPNQLVFLTLGKEGSLCYYNQNVVKSHSIKVMSVDTTGAGDAFYGAILSQLDRIGFENFVKDKNVIKEVLRFANLTGALTTTKKGAIDALPTLEEINTFTK